MPATLMYVLTNETTGVDRRYDSLNGALDAVNDNVGNSDSVSTVVKVDTTDPTISLALANATGDAYWPGSGSRVFFRPGGNGGFDVSATVADADSGIASTTFPAAGAMGANWSVSGSGTSRTIVLRAT